MARKKAAAAPTGFMMKLLGWMASIVKSDFVKMLISAILAGGTAGYTVSSGISGMIPNGKLPSIPKLLPRPFKAEDAIGRIQFGNSGCTGTLVGPIADDDAQVDILTAAHCVNVGAVGKMKLKDGRLLTVRCVSRDAKADVAWLRADRPEGTIPNLLLAELPPPPGSRVWHMGYGIDKPGNLEEGTVTGISPNNLQVQYRLSVSPGDSGGGIIATKEGKVISPVCCTTRLAATGDVWGGTPDAARKIRPSRATYEFAGPLAVHPMIDIDDRLKTTGEPWID